MNGNDGMLVGRYVTLNFQDQGFDENDEPQEVQQAVPKKRGKISEYEISLLWNTIQDNNFPGGRVNKTQLNQMLRRVSGEIICSCMDLGWFDLDLGVLPLKSNSHQPNQNWADGGKLTL